MPIKRNSSDESLEDSVRNRLDVAIDRMLDTGRRERYAELHNIKQTGEVERNSRKLEIEFTSGTTIRSAQAPVDNNGATVGGAAAGSPEGAESLPVISEITDLSKQRKVTRLLESFLFRNQLEKSISRSAAHGNRAMPSTGILKKRQHAENVSSPDSTVTNSTAGSDSDNRGSEQGSLLRGPSRPKRPTGTRRAPQPRRRATEAPPALAQTPPVVSNAVVQPAAAPSSAPGANMNLQQYEQWLQSQLAMVHWMAVEGSTGGSGISPQQLSTMPPPLNTESVPSVPQRVEEGPSPQQPDDAIVTEDWRSSEDEDVDYSDMESMGDVDDDDETGQILIGSALGDVAEDNLISDLVELAHWQIVSRALRSEVRTILENHLQDRIGTISSRGNMRSDSSRSSTPSGERRGARGGQTRQSETRGQQPATDRPQQQQQQPQEQQQQQVPTNSVQPAQRGGERGTAGPRLGTDSARRIRVLEVKMRELMSLVKMSFDVQLDVKRALHQEVAAAFHQQGVTDSFPHSTEAAADGQCIICLDKSIDSVLYQCGHMCCCLQCGHRLRDQGLHCPLCRAPISDIVRVFRVQTHQDEDSE